MFNKKNKILAIATVLFLLILIPVFSLPSSEKDVSTEGIQQELDSRIETSEYAAIFRSVLHYVSNNYVDEVPKNKLFLGAARGMFYSVKETETTDEDEIEKEYKEFYKRVLWSISANNPETEYKEQILKNLLDTENTDTHPNFTSSEYESVFLSTFNFIYKSNEFETTKRKLFADAMRGLFESIGDPHTSYLDQSQILDLTDTTDGEFGGLGIHIQKLVVGNNSDNKSKELPYVKIISPIHGTPAFRAGLKAGDYITHIEGESTVDLTSDDVLKRLRGKPGSSVTITILRDRAVNFDIKIKRAIIEIPTEEHAIIDGIGYLKIIQFTHHSSAQIEKVFNEFNAKGVKGVIIDVRNNPGGLLYSVIDIADQIFSGGVIVSTKSRIQSENAVFKAKRGTVLNTETPIVVLINNGSASASEILTAVIKDNGRGTVIGTKTFGKGSVQQVRQFGEGGFKMTVARFYSPNDVTIDKIGIEPDIEVKEPTIRDLTEEETVSFIELLEERTIGNYLLENKEITEEMILELAESILKEGYNIPKEFLINDIRHRVDRNKENPPLYDLEHDEPLKKAIEFLDR